MAVVDCIDYKVVIDENPSILTTFIEQLKPSKIFVIVDNNTKKYCLPYLEETLKLQFTAIQIMQGERFKNLKTCTQIWDALIKNGCDRKSLVINLGGGVIGDMGGFVAATYMRGVHFIQMPTTLLSQVDASVGGKLAIDFLDYKNMVGLFQNPDLVWINTEFLQTLSPRELSSGYAEVIKHALIKSPELWDIIKDKANLDYTKEEWTHLVDLSVRIKKEVVTEDPFEKGLRKILNYGHTVGHAVESSLLNTDHYLLHGEAIAIGMICENFISYKSGLLSPEEMKVVNQYLLNHYPLRPRLSIIKDQAMLMMNMDKKNASGKKSFSLIESIGTCNFDQFPDNFLIEEALAYFDNIN